MMVVAIVLAIPLASVAGTVISVVLSVALGPLLIVGLATGFDRAARRLLTFFAGVVIVLFVLVRIFGVTSAPPNPATAGNAAQPPASTAEQIVTFGLGGLLLLGMIVGVIVLIALWMRRTPQPEGGVGETRTIDPSGDGIASRRRRKWLGRQPEPATAVLDRALVRARRGPGAAQATPIRPPVASREPADRSPGTRASRGPWRSCRG